MEPIQTDVSDQALVTAIRANMCEYFQRFRRLCQIENFSRVLG